MNDNAFSAQRAAEKLELSIHIDSEISSYTILLILNQIRFPYPYELNCNFSGLYVLFN